ncbi:phosphate ABC transporter ATP-binding protein PstB [Egbenema bharatensis]|uniref:phosphate ABC transporter ATP-binding protein PstB n=1 Tax=Egbenema bharatensis TaxID=3463334 RepID=UPI003A87E1EE
MARSISIAITPRTETILEAENVSVHYGAVPAIQNVTLDIPKNQVTSFIGPSGSGKSTLLRCFNRMNDFIPGVRLSGKLKFEGVDLYAGDVDPVQVRRRIGMIFQRANPLPKSVYENIAFGARVNGYPGDMDELVERTLRRADLWDEVKDKLWQSGLSLSGGQQQRLCLARVMAIEPKVLLMDEPCSALDPHSTLQIENLLTELKQQYTIVIITHNIQQAGRISDWTAFFNSEVTDRGRLNHLVEFAPTKILFSTPREQATQDYVSGRFG